MRVGVACNVQLRHFTSRKGKDTRQNADAQMSGESAASQGYSAGGGSVRSRGTW